MERFSRTPPSGRIRSFFIKDILEHKRNSAPPPESPPKSSIMVDHETHTVTNPVKTYSVQHLLATDGRPVHQPDACASGCCEFSAVYTHKSAPSSFYHPYLYSMYRHQAAWRPLRDGVSFVDPQNGMYAQSKQRKPRRPWTRAVFSNLQRKGLEKRFQVQKYLTKGDRHQLASMLGLSDNQVKVWFQNRRMKWRQEEQTQDEPTASDKSAKDKPLDTQTTTTVSLNNDSVKTSKFG